MYKTYVFDNFQDEGVNNQMNKVVIEARSEKFKPDFENKIEESLKKTFGDVEITFEDEEELEEEEKTERVDTGAVGEKGQITEGEKEEIKDYGELIDERVKNMKDRDLPDEFQGNRVDEFTKKMKKTEIAIVEIENERYKGVK